MAVEYSRAFSELGDAIKLEDLEARLHAVGLWAEKWLVQADTTIGYGTADGEARSAIRRETIAQMGAELARRMGDDVVTRIEVDGRTDKLVVTMFRGTPNLGSAPDAVVLPFRKRSE